MSMQTYGFTEAAALVVTPELTVILNRQTMDPPEGLDPDKMSHDRLLVEYGDMEAVFDALDAKNTECLFWFSEFYGDATPFQPKDESGDKDIHYDGDILLCITSEYAPDLFKAPYPNFEALLDEFRGKLEAAGYDVKGLDLAPYVYAINGTYDS